MSYFSDDTIVAIATSLAGDAGVGIIRLSGKNALKVTQQISPDFQEPNPRYLQRIKILQKSGDILDEGLGVFFPEGASFTGEEVIELQLHGGRFLLQKILSLLLSTGLCRMAKPGEFMFRAVKNGKMSLQNASAVNQLVKAQSQYEFWSARQNLSQQKLKDYEGLISLIREHLARVELSIDFIEQDVEVIEAASTEDKLDEILSLLQKLQKKNELSQRIAQGPLVVITGAPNVGKSSLFNAILGEDRAIVSDEAGTTRDVITEEFLLDPYRLRLADTAGIRESNNFIEKEGIERAGALLAQADLVVGMIEAKEYLNNVGAEKFLVKPQILLVNKTDNLDPAEQKALVPQKDVIFISAKKAAGIESFLMGLKSKLDEKFGIGLNTPLPTEFQLQMLKQCEDEILKAKDLVKSTGTSHPELLASNLAKAARALSDIVGETSPDLILNKIFSEFCIGK